MRLDRYLKLSRLIKRRSVAKEVAEGGRILINGKTAKPSSEIKIGDEIEMHLGRNIVGVKVLTLNEHANLQEAEDMYEILYQEHTSERRS
ncbi:MAG: RNA-binding S4 domain-containing protein [Bacilli bacterium]|jgi:ribosomal 50S subunit-recycling heat shock protein|nr:RNA-binding S4 domain-containing protein [Bacilli bacterium]